MQFLRFDFVGKAFQYQFLRFGPSLFPRTSTGSSETGHLCSQLYRQLVDLSPVTKNDGSTSGAQAQLQNEHVSPPSIQSIQTTVTSIRLGQAVTVEHFQRLLWLMATASNMVPFGQFYMIPLKGRKVVHVLKSCAGTIVSLSWHINCLEILTVFYALRCFLPDL